MADVRLDTVTMTYEGNNAPTVDELSLDVRDGEFMVLVGPSGCGKSTTLRLIAGLESAGHGTISIGGRIVNDVEPKDRDIAMVFQNYALYPHMSVFDNMAFGLKLRKFPKSEIRHRVEEAADMLGLADVLQRKPRALSGGQRQRVALGRAIVRKPNVFLFDEPLSNLDAKLRVLMRTEIKRLHKLLGTTIIYVTHDQVEAMTMGDRITVMNNGAIHQIDTPMKLYTEPADLFVAGFIGNPAMNFFDVRFEPTDPPSATWNGVSFALPPHLPPALLNLRGTDVTIGIRPEHIHIHADACEHPVSLSLLHDVSELLGNETFLYLSAGTQQIVLRCPPASHVEPGERITVHLDVARAHFFNRASGMRITP